MKNHLSLLCGLVLALQASATQVYLVESNFTGHVMNRDVHVRLRTQASGSLQNPVFGTPTVWHATNGVTDTNTLLAATYLVDIDQIAKTFVMPVPDGTNVYNAWDLINAGSSMDQPFPGLAGGSNVTITTNYVAGFPVLTISSTGGGGGSATNAYQVQVSGAGLTLSTNALQFLYTLSLNANLQSWGAITPATKQDASTFQTFTNSIGTAGFKSLAELDARYDAANSAVAVQAALTASNTVYQAQFAGKQAHSSNLDLWSGRTIDGTTIVETGGILSAPNGGSGNVSGSGSSTTGNFAALNNGTSTAIVDSGKNASSFDVAGAAGAVQSNLQSSNSVYLAAIANKANTNSPTLLTPSLSGVTKVAGDLWLDNNQRRIRSGDPINPGSWEEGYIEFAAPSPGVARMTINAGDNNDLFVHSDSVITLDTDSGVYIQGGGAYNGDGTGLLFPGGIPSNTNGPMSSSNVFAAIIENTTDLSAWRTAGQTNIMGVGDTTNAVPVGLGDNVSLVGGNLHASITGAGISPMVVSNILISQTNEIVWDLQKAQHLSLLFTTNLNKLTVSNAWAITNSPSGIAQLETLEDTNGTWRILTTNVASGLLRAAGGWIRGTNASQDDIANVRLDWTGTNIVVRWDTNIQPIVSITNTMTAGGGGGGGGTWTIVSHMNGVGTNVSAPLNASGATMEIAYVEGGGFSTFTDSGNHTWTMLNDPNNNPRASFYYAVGSFSSSQVFTNVGSGGTPKSFLVVAVTKTSPVFDVQGAGSGGNFYSGQSQSPGSMTPTTAADFMVSGIIFDTQASTTGASIDSGFTVLESQHFSSGSNMILAYKTKSDSAAESPIWSATWGFGPGADTTDGAFK